MLLINFKVESKLKWSNHCVLSAGGNDDNIIFNIKGT